MSWLLKQTSASRRKKVRFLLESLEARDVPSGGITSITGPPVSVHPPGPMPPIVVTPPGGTTPPSPVPHAPPIASNG
jgi:hypothetical protein